MKLGDSGEAFFVEEVASSDIENIPDHLATSPIPVSEFEKLYVPEGKPRRKSIDLGFNDQPVYENQVSDYKTRRYTDSHDQDYTLKKRDFVQRQIGLGNIELGEHSNEDISRSESKKLSDEDPNQDSEISEPIFKMEGLDDPPKESIPPKIELKVEGEKPEPEIKSGKKKRRKKSIMKKKNSQRKTSMISSNENNDGQEVNDGKMAESITDKSSLGSSQSEHDLITNSEASTSGRMGRDPDFLFFSDTELTANR